MLDNVHVDLIASFASHHHYYNSNDVSHVVVGMDEVLMVLMMKVDRIEMNVDVMKGMMRMNLEEC